jgi:hypothetical protein
MVFSEPLVRQAVQKWRERSDFLQDGKTTIIVIDMKLKNPSAAVAGLLTEPHAWTARSLHEHRLYPENV